MQTGGTLASLSSFTSPWAETVLSEKAERKKVYVNFGPQQQLFSNLASLSGPQLFGQRLLSTSQTMQADSAVALQSG